MSENVATSKTHPEHLVILDGKILGLCEAVKPGTKGWVVKLECREESPRLVRHFREGHVQILSEAEAKELYAKGEAQWDRTGFDAFKAPARKDANGRPFDPVRDVAHRLQYLINQGLEELPVERVRDHLKTCVSMLPEYGDES